MRCDGGKTCHCGKPADSLPGHSYVLSHAAVDKCRVVRNMLDIRDPDDFGMHTFNDHACYGALEVLQNIMLDFDEAYQAKDWRETWVNVETLAMFMEYAGGTDICICDDGQMVTEAAKVLAKIPLVALTAIEKENKDPAWDPRNIDYIISLYIKVARTLRDQSLLEKPIKHTTKTFKWNASNLNLYLLEIARERDITPVGFEKKEVDEVAGLTMPDTSKRDPWNWTRTFKQHIEEVGVPMYAYHAHGRQKIGGDGLDITTWTPKERKDAAFNGKDPVPPSMVKKLKEGLVMMRG